MGISDKDYANALEHQRLHQVALMKLELDKQKEEAKMGLLQNALSALGGAGQNALQSNGTGGYYNPAQQQQAMNNSSITQAYPNSVTLNTNAINTSWDSRVQLGVKILNEQDLQHDAMKAPLSALVDMWTMRWQGEWVNETEFAEDDFWRLALIRLTGANKLEKHHLANQYSAVYRIIE